MVVFKLIPSAFVLFYVVSTVHCAQPFIEDQNDGFIKDNLNIVPTNCDFIFNGNSFPTPKDNEGRGLIKLCQNQVKDDYKGPVVLATLYSTSDRIPAYTANVVMLYQNVSKLPRPDSGYWHRVSLSLCAIDPDEKLPSDQILSKLGSIADELNCRKYQATYQDYYGNNKLIGIDRGHLSPNSINNQDKEKQIATFTLTNAAPQFSEFNRNAWMVYECVVMYIIKQYVPMERVYVITGTHGYAQNDKGKEWWMNADDDGYKIDENKNPVLIPGYYWKAVCYPGNPWLNKPAWSFAVMQKNSALEKLSHAENFIPIQKFSDQYFESDIFGPACMKAESMGPVTELFDDWEKNAEDLCLSQRPWTKTNNGKGEL